MKKTFTQHYLKHVVLFITCVVCSVCSLYGAHTQANLSARKAFYTGLGQGIWTVSPAVLNSKWLERCPEPEAPDIGVQMTDFKYDNVRNSISAAGFSKLHSMECPVRFQAYISNIKTLIAGCSNPVIGFCVKSESSDNQNSSVVSLRQKARLPQVSAAFATAVNLGFGVFRDLHQAVKSHVDKRSSYFPTGRLGAVAAPERYPAWGCKQNFPVAFHGGAGAFEALKNDYNCVWNERKNNK